MVQVIKMFPGFDLSITSSENTGNWFYVMKEDSRVEGPWSSKDPEDIPLPRQVREMGNLWDWQKHVLNSKNYFDSRIVNVIIDSKGGEGKSSFGFYLKCNRLGQYLPYSNDFRDIMRMVMQLPKTDLYIIDLPRAVKKEKLYQFWSGVEMLKSGYAYDDRYKFREAFFDCPTVWIFSNLEPDLQLLSNDRWKLWSIYQRQLVDYVRPIKSGEFDNSVIINF